MALVALVVLVALVALVARRTPVVSRRGPPVFLRR
ncbi:hypothetical protein FsymDg_0650 [Candidatus Protofrankia datiscae]|uniref:Uncharacterized protein n=1 Tax=Candidatus Protofrankia datiscae TaxID=2716812 RepID=F8AV83_9ACTN|nr:hypothetical protein FsymDg_0650 [Candidatus Protofrankia datiscae]